MAAMKEWPLVLSREEVRQFDRTAIEKYGVPGAVLMENAGRGVVEALAEIDPHLFENTSGARSKPTRVAILCGKGNNAGDGFVIARHLAIRGVQAATLLLYSPDELTGDAKLNHDVLRGLGLPCFDLADAADDAKRLIESFEDRAGGAAWLIDAMLGTGAAGEPREPVATAIRWMNAQPARRLAVDIPSGLDCDAGTAAAATVRADATCTFVAAKRGFLEASAAEFLGDVRIISIGLPVSAGLWP